MRSSCHQGRHHHFCIDHKAADSAADDDKNCQYEEESIVSSSSGIEAGNTTEQHSHGHSSAAKPDRAVKQQKRIAAGKDSSDQPYDSYKMSAVNKLVTELARKQRECRKAKLHAVVRFKPQSFASTQRCCLLFSTHISATADVNISPLRFCIW